jgi:hypothetical protein
MFDRDSEEYDRVEDNLDVPGFLLRNRKRFGYLLNRDSADAGLLIIRRRRRRRLSSPEERIALEHDLKEARQCCVQEIGAAIQGDSFDHFIVDVPLLRKTTLKWKMHFRPSRPR